MLFAGKPLVQHAVECAYESKIFDRVCVSSEDEEILNCACFCGAQAVRRPQELAGDSAQVKQVCSHLLRDFSAQGLDYTAFCVLLPTNPLRKPADIINSWELFQRSGADYVMSLAPFSHPPQRALCIKNDRVSPYFSVDHMRPAQQLTPLYFHDGGVLWGKTQVLLQLGEFFSENVVPYFTPFERAVDIDSPLDLFWAEFLHQRTADAPFADEE